MSSLLLSLPGSTNIEVFKESSAGSMSFSFVPFTGSQSLNLRFTASSVAPLEIPLQASNSKSSSHSEEEYRQFVKQTRDYIREQKLGKIVTSRSEFLSERVDPLSTFYKLVKAYPDVCVYMFQHPLAGVWIGATPELLLSVSDQRLQTMSLAGTIANHIKASFTEKELVEQSLVTDEIVGQLQSEPGISDLKVYPKEEVTAGSIRHLRTRIEALVNSSLDTERLLSKLHPTPAVAGFPRREALRFLKENEAYNRSFYAGYFLIKRNKNWQAFVNLRCMQVFSNGLLLYAGGGITAQSDPAAEWEETQNKMNTLKDVIFD